jgi:hypothetical protein
MPGDDFDGPPEVYDVNCARCGKLGTSEKFYVEEGDEWECLPCWERCEAIERARSLSPQGPDRLAAAPSVCPEKSQP